MEEFIKKVINDTMNGKNRNRFEEISRITTLVGAMILGKMVGQGKDIDPADLSNHTAVIAVQILENFPKASDDDIFEITYETLTHFYS